MKKFLITGVLALACVVPAKAQDASIEWARMPTPRYVLRHGPRHFYADWRWWLGEGVIGLSNALDAHSTCNGFGYGAIESGDPLIRGTRSSGDVAKVATLSFGIQTTLHALIWHCSESSFHPLHCYGMNQDVSKHKTIWQAFELSTMPAIAAGAHIPAAIHNYELVEIIAPLRQPHPCYRDCE